MIDRLDRALRPASAGMSGRLLYRASAKGTENIRMCCGSEHASTEILNEDRRAPASVLPSVAASISHWRQGGHSSPGDGFPSAPCRRAVLGRFMGRPSAAATTPAALQSLRRLLGRSPGGLLGRSPA